MFWVNHKLFLGFVHNIWKNPKENFGQPNNRGPKGICWNTMKKILRALFKRRKVCLMSRIQLGWHCCCSVAKLCLTLSDPVDYSTPGFPVLHHLLEFAHTHVHWVGDAIQPSLSSSVFCHLLLLLSLIFSSITVFSNESVLGIGWPKYWSFSFHTSPSSEYSELISFRIDWFDLLAVQGTLKSLLQHCSSKASILWHSAFFMVQLSHPYMASGKTIG